MPDSTPATLKHQRDPIHPLREALCGERYGWRTSNPGEVTCFACRRHVNFNTEWGVGTPTPPVKLSGVMLSDDGLQRLMDEVLKSCRNERGMFVIEESIHHGEYRSTRRVEVHAINAVTVDAVIQSSAYAYGSWLHPDNPEHKEARNTQLHQLVADLRTLRINRSIGWSTFRLITEH